MAIKFPRGFGNARVCHVILEPDDTYTVVFLNDSGKEKSRFEDVYCDSLKKLIETEMGLYLSL